ncbi:MAG: glutathione S-transferase family protein [Pseudomonadales bacterium]|nr:glutathione S-transferase family protein [Pseudomonadales bacterium]
MIPTLHHYPPSLFSEKVRALLGYLQLEWHSVIIPPIMPRPDLMPLSGGYRKTPIMQIGANVYCDSEIICRRLAELAGDQSLYAQGFNAERVARWADTELFRTVVALNFRPQAIAAQMSRMSAADIEAFQKDRADLSAGAPIVSVDPAAAEAQFKGLLQSLENSLAAEFLFGDTPGIADFSLYHCLWFVAGNAANASLLEGWPKIQAYMQRIAEFGHGKPTEMSSREALTVGMNAEPVAPANARVDPRIAGDLHAGDPVTVAANDYGRNPIAGSLVSWTANEIVIQRNDPKVGAVMIHFPNIGFEVTATDR